MRLQDMADRLAKEFPGKVVSFGIDVWSHGNTGNTSLACTIYTPETHIIDCISFEDGLAKLRAALSPAAVAQDVTFDDEPRSVCRTCGCTIYDGEMRKHLYSHRPDADSMTPEEVTAQFIALKAQVSS